MSAYGGEWERQRQRAIDRDGHKCVSCGVPESDLDGQRHLQVHHQLPVSVFREQYDEVPWEIVHHLSNLVTLCDVCHQRAEDDNIHATTNNFTAETRRRFYSMKPFDKSDSEFVEWLMDQAERHHNQAGITENDKSRVYRELEHDIRAMVRDELEQFGRKYL